jgi:hypothetical protein
MSKFRFYRAGGVALALDHLPSKCEALVQTPVLPKINKIIL